MCRACKTEQLSRRFIVGAMCGSDASDIEQIGDHGGTQAFSNYPAEAVGVERVGGWR
jgi:hypothetical protein